MEEFDDLDIQNYTLTIIPILAPDQITITGFKGTEGLNHL